MIRIDLLPKEERVRRRVPKVPTVRVRVPVRGGTFFVVGIILLILFFMGFFLLRQKAEIRRLDSEIAEMKAELTDLAREVQLVKELTKRQEEIEHWLGVIEKLNENRFLRAHLLDEVATLLPDYVWLSSLIESALSLTIEGRAFSNLIVADFMLRLMGSPYFNNIELSLVKRAKVGEQDVMDFKLTAALVPYKPSALKASSSKSSKKGG